MPRRTLASQAVIEGIGLHTGAHVTATCMGATAGQGIVFRRVDLPGAPEVPARLSQVRSTERRTALGDAPGSTLNDTGSSQDMQSGGMGFGVDLMPTASVNYDRSSGGVQIEDVTGADRDDNYSGK